MRCYSHLSDDEREQIGLAKAVGHSIGAIAKAIGRPKSTVSRELLRNRLPSGRYSPLHAAGAYQLRGTRIVSAGGDDGIVRLWTLDGTAAQPFKGNSGSVAFSTRTGRQSRPDQSKMTCHTSAGLQRSNCSAQVQAMLQGRHLKR
jgi:hypothetical protein